MSGPHNGASSFTHVLIVLAGMRKGCSLEKQRLSSPRESCQQSQSFFVVVGLPKQPGEERQTFSRIPVLLKAVTLGGLLNPVGGGGGHGEVVDLSFPVPLAGPVQQAPCGRDVIGSSGRTGTIAPTSVVIVARLSSSLVLQGCRGGWGFLAAGSLTL